MDDRRTPDVDDEEIRRRFDAIVEGWEPADAPEPGDVRSLPVAPGVEAPWRGSPTSLVDGVLDGSSADEPPSSGPAAPDDFVPPQPGLPPANDTGFWVATAGLVLGPALLLWLAFARPAASSWWMWLGIALTVAGFAAMVLRQPRHRDTDDDHPDGAQV